jgi:hypothetical protein|tara:strand:- start:1550 stop:1771 length:222 start_codon:yes stop_codon:yes gene_type:complete
MAEKDSSVSWGSVPRNVKFELASAGFARDKKSWERLGVTLQNQLIGVHKDSKILDKTPKSIDFSVRRDNKVRK